MYLLTFLMFSLTAIAQGSNRLSEPDFKAANFAKAIEDRTSHPWQGDEYMPTK